jgi:outer membrane receptor protein involved in Fe transport
MRIKVVVLLLAGSLAAFAQAPTATLVGRIVDASHAAIPGVEIKVRQLDTNAIRTAQTDELGEYTVSALAPGFYEVTFDKAGFKKVIEQKLELQADQSARVDLELTVGAVTEAVEVSAETTLLNTETSSRGDVVTPTEIAEIPLNGRNFSDLVFNIAGVGPAEQSYKGSPYVMNGARADASGILIDGINDQTPRDASPQAQPPLDALQEFKLLSSGYSAEYGRLAGGQVQMVLRSGANRVYGEVFEYLRNDAMDARNFFDGAVKSELRRNQYGGQLGGPVFIPKLYNGHDKTFFLFSWESYRAVAGDNSIGVVPSLLERQGNFTQSVTATGAPIFVKDPLLKGSCTATVTTACFPGNIIPAARINPVSAALLQYYPLPNLVGSNNEISNEPTRDRWNNYLFKVDQMLGAKDRISVAALDKWEVSFNPYAGGGLPGFASTTPSLQELYSIAETRIFSPTLINEIRTGITRTVSAENSSNQGTYYAGQLGIPGTTTDVNLEGFPKVTVTGFETVGDSTSDPIRYAVTNYDYNDVVTKTKGKHTIKFGADYMFTEYYQPTNSNFNGTFAFNGKDTSDGIGDMLLGYTSSTSRKIGTVTNHIKEYFFSAFVQDDYKITPRLTVNLGLRYEIQGAPYEENGIMTSYVPGLGKAIVGSTATVPNFAALVASANLTPYVGVSNQVGLPAALVNTNYDNFAPRVGFAFRPFADNKTVIRGGYGIFYTGSRLSAMRTDITGGFPFSISQSFTGTTTTPTALTISNPFPAALATITGTTTTDGYEVNPPSPYLQSWNFTIEREIGKGIAVEVAYTGSKGTHLGRKFDLNQEIRTSTDVLSNGQYPRPYPGFSEIDYYSFGYNSEYEAGTITLKKQFHHGVLFRFNYTYGKSIDENSGLNYAGAGDFNGAQNSLDTMAERGLSDFDVRNNFNGVFVVQSPWHNNMFVKGWQFAGDTTIYSGQPFTPYVSGANVDLAEASRPNRIANGSIPNPGPTDWFNLNAFQIVPDSAFAFGNSGRNILEGPGTLAINLSLARDFHIGERNRIQFRFETFNVTNHTNFDLPADALDKANAGTITGNKPPRNLQLALKYMF